MNKQFWIIANWKSNKTIAESLVWLESVGPNLKRIDNIKIVVCPSFPALPELKKAIMVGNYPILLGAQDISPYDEGAFTGEVSNEQLKELVSLVIVGHSERRKYFKEDDHFISQKAAKALELSITPLLCVQDENTVVPEGIKLMAYEPVFAIGTGTPDTPESAQKVSRTLKSKHGADIEVLYGGSVTEENTISFLKEEDINGLLIGKASLDPEQFTKIINVAYNS